MKKLNLAGILKPSIPGFLHARFTVEDSPKGINSPDVYDGCGQTYQTHNSEKDCGRV